MNYHALCFVDMPFGQKPELKASSWWILIKSTTRRSNQRLRDATEEAAAGLTLGYSEWEFLQRRCRQECLEFIQLISGGLCHPLFGSGAERFLEPLLTRRFLP